MTKKASLDSVVYINNNDGAWERVNKRVYDVNIFVL